MGKKSPPAPDYKGAAIAEGKASKENIIEQTWANRPDQYNPWGTTKWEQQVVKDPVTGENRTKWIQRESLDPTLQNTLDAEFALQNKRTNQASDLYDRAGALLNTPFNPYLTGWGETPTYQEQGNLNLGLFGGNANTARTGNWNPAVNKGYLNNDQINDLRQKSEDAMYARQTSRLDPQFQQERERKEAQLTAMGLRPTDPAWQEQMDQFNRGRNDAYEQARLGSIGEGRNEYETMFGTGLQAQQFGNQAAQQNLMNRWQDLQQDNSARQQNFQNQMAKLGYNNEQIAQMWNAEEQQRQQTFNNQMASSNYQNALRTNQMQEQAYMRSQPLNEINALIHGQQVANPQFQNFSQAAAAKTPEFLKAAGMQYEADLNRNNYQNSFMGGLFNNALGIGMSMFSDRRLKRHIRKIGESHGLNVYAFQYVWGQPSVGFMADEVAAKYPAAVSEHESGYLMVDYGQFV